MSAQQQAAWRWKGRRAMKFSFVLGAAIGYLLGARAGRERYEHLVAIGRRVIGSQTVQATAGVVEAQLHELLGRVRRTAGHHHG